MSTKISKSFLIENALITSTLNISDGISMLEQIREKEFSLDERNEICTELSSFVEDWQNAPFNDDGGTKEQNEYLDSLIDKAKVSIEKFL